MSNATARAPEVIDYAAASDLAGLDDPSRFVVLRGVPIFRPHVRRDRDGKVTAKVGLADLDKIAAVANRRAEGSGDVVRLTLGHTVQRRDDGEPVPEDRQPRPVGYAKRLRRGSLRGGKPALVADLYVRREDWKDAKTYPFRSAEYYPDTHEITGVAFLRRDPELDLGALLYARDATARTLAAAWDDGEVDALAPLSDRLEEIGDIERADACRRLLVCYGRAEYRGRPLRYVSTEDDPMADRDPSDRGWDDDDAGAAGGPTAHPDADAPPPDDPDENVSPQQMAEEFARHCMSHKYARRLGDHYAAAGAPAAAPAMPGATNPLPGGAGDDDDAMHLGRRREPARYARLEADVAQLRREVETGRKEVEAARRQARLATYARELDALEAEGILFDKDEETEAAREMTAEQFGKHVAKMRKNYQRDPAAGGLLRVADGERDGSGGRGGEISQARLDQCLRYMRERGVNDFDQAMREAPRS